jgi:hypothetical protein
MEAASMKLAIRISLLISILALTAAVGTDRRRIENLSERNVDNLHHFGAE